MYAFRISATRCATGVLSRPGSSIAVLHRPVSTPLLPPPPSTQQIRHASWFGWGRKRDEDAPPTSPESRSLKELLKASPKSGAAQQSQLLPTFEKGGLASTSIFGEEPTTTTEPSTGQTRTATAQEFLALVDPNRESTWSWPKRFEARQYRRRGRLTKRMQIYQTERSHTAKSHWIKTSVKKLAPLARQIAGMNLNDAIVQMRFSPKKASTDIMNLLGQARMEAMVRRGMTDGEMYVSEAWVGRGTYEKEMSHRARGRIDMLMKPYTSITIVLKENATRERLAKEKAEKEARKKVWVQLPNKPIYGQHQYYRW